MSNELVPTSKPWGLALEKYFYFFMGLRKGEIRKQVAMMKKIYPDDDAHALARRFVAGQVPLSMLGGMLAHIPLLVPTVGPALKLLGVAAGASLMVRLNMTLFLQIALLFGHDIDDRARLKELVAVIAASGLAGGTTLLPQLLTLSPSHRVLINGGAVASVSQLIGEAAIRYYGGAVGQVDMTEPQAAVVSA